MPPKSIPTPAERPVVQIFRYFRERLCRYQWRRSLIVLTLTGAALRIAGATLIPFAFLSQDWEMAIKMKCLERQDLCISVRSQDALVGGYWNGRALHFTARFGKSAQLKAIVVHDMPDGSWRRHLSPWGYVGATFTEVVPRDS